MDLKEDENCHLCHVKTAFKCMHLQYIL